MTTKKKRVAIDPTPWCCAICGDGNQLNKKRGKIRHHVSYTPEITIILCKRCHLRLHGTGRCFNHPFEKAVGPAMGPRMFAISVVLAYDDAFDSYSANEVGNIRAKKRADECKVAGDTRSPGLPGNHRLDR
jgi:hypothetical protein